MFVPMAPPPVGKRNIEISVSVHVACPVVVDRFSSVSDTLRTCSSVDDVVFVQQIILSSK